VTIARNSEYLGVEVRDWSAPNNVATGSPR
jgi:hypothetical protein